MPALVEIPLLVGESLALWWAYRRSGFLIFPHALLVFLIAGQFVLWLNAIHVVENDMLEGYSSYQFETHLPAFTALLIAFGAVSVAVTPPRSRQATFRTPDFSERAINVVIGILHARALLHFALIDKQQLWTNREYMLLSSPRLINGPAILAQTQPIWAMAVAATFFHLFFGGRRRLSYRLLPLFAWECWFETASHSRMAFAMIAIGAAIAFTRRRHLLASLSLGAISAALLLNALAGRAQTEQGLSSIVAIPATIGGLKTSDVVVGINNLFEGMFVTSELFSGHYDYPTVYKVLSLSPLPSFVDGFDRVNHRYQQGLSSYVPMSSGQELINFGAGYILIYCATFFLAGRLSARALQERPDILSLLANALVTLGAIVQLAYPVRNSFRYFILSIGITALLRFAPGLSLRGRRRVPQRRGSGRLTPSVARAGQAGGR